MYSKSCFSITSKLWDLTGCYLQDSKAAAPRHHRTELQKSEDTANRPDHRGLCRDLKSFFSLSFSLLLLFLLSSPLISHLTSPHPRPAHPSLSPLFFFSPQLPWSSFIPVPNSPLLFKPTSDPLFVLSLAFFLFCFLLSLFCFCYKSRKGKKGKRSHIIYALSFHLLTLPSPFCWL